MSRSAPPSANRDVDDPAAYSSFVSTFLPSIFIDCLRLAPVWDCVTDDIPPALLPPMTIDCELLRPLWFCEKWPVVAYQAVEKLPQWLSAAAFAK